MTTVAHRICTIALLALTAAMPGCAHLERPDIPDVLVDPPAADKPNGTYTIADFDTDLLAYSTATKPTAPTPGEKAAAIAARNKMVYGVMAEIDYVYHNYEVSLFMNEGSFKVAGDVLQLGLGTAATITNGERAKTVLGAALTGVSGVNLSIDKNFFRQQTVQALMSSMQANRDRIKATILQRLNEDAVTYPFQAARSDLTAYFFAGTLPAALQQLHQTAATEATKARGDLEAVALKNVTAEDVKNATDINMAIRKAMAAGDVQKVVTYLTAMDHPPADNTAASIMAALQLVANDVIQHPQLKAKQVQAARTAGLIP